MRYILAFLGGIVISVACGNTYQFYTSHERAPSRLGISADEIVPYVQEAGARCMEIDDPIARYVCLRRVADGLLDTFAFREITRAFKGTSIDCHDLMHFVAQDAYARDPDLGKLYAHSENVCFGAAYHGGIEGMVIASHETGQDMVDIANALPTMCAFSAAAPREYSQCMHGMGHGFMFVTGGDLSRSLALCDEAEGVDASICYGGVFMENVPSSALNPHAGQYIRREDPLYPCNILDERYEQSCYTYQANLYSEWSGGHLLVFGGYCSGVPEAYRVDCFRTLGTTLRAYTDEDTPKAFVRACDRLGVGIPEEIACVEGVVISYGDLFSGDREKLGDIFAVCAAAESALKRSCYVSAGSMARSFVDSYADIEPLCPDEYRLSCEANWHDGGPGNEKAAIRPLMPEV